MLKRLMAQGFRKIGSIADDGTYYLKRVCCNNNSWNASKGARAQGVKLGGTINRYTTPELPAGTIVTDFVQMNSDDTVNHYFRRASLNAPQGSNVSVFRGGPECHLLDQVGWWHS